MRYIFSGDQDFLYNAYMLQTGDSLTITAGSRLVTSQYSGSTLIEATGSTIQNDGTITGNGRSPTVWMYRDVVLTNNGVIESTSRYPASSTNGLYLSTVYSWGTDSYGYGRNTVLNNGEIVAKGSLHAIYTSYGAIAVINYGAISAEKGRYAIFIADGWAGMQSMVTNHGIVNGDINVTSASQFNLVNDGVLNGSIDTHDVRSSITNSGQINGDIIHARFVDNSGTIAGSVTLGDASEFFDNSRGVVTGTISGGLGKDVILGGSGRDVIYGDDLANNIYGGDDTIYGGAGNDAIYGCYGADTLYGNQGDDLIYGNQGDDWIHGGQGNDTIYGGQGSDIVNGGVGNDALFGNLGDDRFVFAAGFGHDVIGDFSVVSGNNDVIQFLPGTFATYADVQSHMVQQGDNVVITLDAANDIVLQHITVAQLSADHFLFG